MSMNPDPHTDRWLIVEGNNDAHAIENLLIKCKPGWHPGDPRWPHLQVAGSVEEVLALIPVTIKQQHRAGFILDADSDPTDRWSKVAARFAREHIVLSRQPDPLGTVIPLAGKVGKQAGIWLMPDNQQPGMLEDFIQPLIPTRDDCWQYTREVVDGARLHGAPFKSRHEAKARLHSWLAWQDPPGLPFGHAISKGVLNHDSSAARAFVEWFDRLFS